MMDILRAHLWRLIYTVLGLAAAVSCLTLGFFVTFFILLCCGIGYIIGFLKDKNIKFSEVLSALRRRR